MTSQGSLVPTPPSSEGSIEGVVASLPSPTPPPDRTDQVAPLEGRSHVWLIVGAIVVFVGAGMHLAFDLDRAGSVWFWVYAVVPTLALAVVALARLARDGELRGLLMPAWGDATRGILSTAVLLAGAAAASHLIAPTGSPRESWLARLYLQIGDPNWLRAHAASTGAVLVVAAAAEEIVWRGLVTRLLAEKVGSRTAWIWAAIPYALAHLPTVWALRDPEAGLNPVLVLGALGLGLVWGALARQTGRLPPVILSHAAFDWVVIMMFRLWGPGL